MKIAAVETLVCDAGWRPWSFVKVTTGDGLVGYSECTESFGSRSGVLAAVHDLAPLVIGRDPRATERIFWDLYRATRQSAGGVVQKAIGGLENALLDLKAKALGIPVYELFGGPVRDRVRVYWSHCGTTRARNWQQVGKPPLRTLDDVAALGREVRDAGFTALKTNLVFPGDPPFVLMQGFKGDDVGHNLNRRNLDGVEALIATFREAVGPGVEIMLDLNFNFKTEGNVRLARRLEPYDLAWLEIDSFDPRALRQVKDAIRIPLTSGENLFTLRGYRPFFESHSMDVASIDVLWNGLAQSKKIADAADVYEMHVAPHNHYSHLATLIAAHFSMAVPNVRILEVDVDDVPWRDDLVTRPPVVVDGYLEVPDGPGWGADLDEEAVGAHPWPG